MVRPGTDSVLSGEAVVDDMEPLFHELKYYININLAKCRLNSIMHLKSERDYPWSHFNQFYIHEKNPDSRRS